MRHPFLLAAFLFIACSTASADIVNFTYTGADVTGLGGTSSGSGNFSFAAGHTTLPLADLTAFHFTQTTTLPAPFGSSTFSYGLGDLLSFSATLTPADVLTSLSLTTGSVSGSNPSFFEESFTVTSLAANGASTSSSGIQLQVGTVKQVAAVPEPVSPLLLLTAIAGLGFASRRRMS